MYHLLLLVFFLECPTVIGGFSWASIMKIEIINLDRIRNYSHIEICSGLS